MANSAHYFARYILDAFEKYHGTFTEITRRAGSRFRNEDWEGMRRDAVERLDVYSRVVDRSVSEILEIIGDARYDEAHWANVKAAYLGIIGDLYHYQLAETFFNSVVRRVFSVTGVNPNIEFTVSDFKAPVIEEKPCPVCTAFSSEPGHTDLSAAVSGIFDRFSDVLPLMDSIGDSRRVAGAVERHLSENNVDPSAVLIEMADPVFYRNKDAYLVGRIVAGPAVYPLVICILNIQGKMFADAVLLETAEISILFSFAYAYFHVEVVNPEEMINFLKSIMPLKRISEIYASLGYHKHGKAELFRELMRRLDQTDDGFEIARGEKGMVMVVFTIPALDVVFKIIRDRFEAPKQTTHAYIRNRYQLVFRHDRAGRLVDVQEFNLLTFDRNRFPDALMQELHEKASKNMTLRDEHVIVHHLYTERRLVPLDVFIRENPPAVVTDVLLDYGWCIKELAAGNIFPGDLFFKNFGVTRWGRVVFYDYDELLLLTDCRFRKMPEPRHHEEIMADEPWFSVNENDVFPEEFRKFLHFPEYAESVFEQAHGELFGVDFWREMQKKINDGVIIHILPYKTHRRFDHRILETSGLYYFQGKNAARG